MHPGSFPVPEPGDPSALTEDRGWETDGRTQGGGGQRD